MFAEQTFGPGGGRALSRASSMPSDRDLLRGISAVGWYPVEPILRFHHALERHLRQGREGFAVCERLGQFSAEWAIKGIFKVFIRFKTRNS